MKEIYLYTGVYDFSVENFMKQIDVSSDEDITVRVCSGGGSVFDGYGIFAKLKEYKGKITVKVDGIAASMASFIPLYGNRIEMIDVGKIMVHAASGRASTDEEKALLAEINSDLLSLYKERVDESYFEEIAGFTLDSVFNGENEKDIWINAYQAKRLGFVDEIISIKPEKRIQAKAFIDSIAASYDFTNQKENNNKITNDKKSNNMSDLKNISLADLRAQRPDLVEALRNEGITAENDRVGSWMAWFDVDPEAVSKGIDSGKDISKKESQVFARKATMVNMAAEAEEESAEETATPPDTKKPESEDKELEAFASGIDELLKPKKD